MKIYISGKISGLPPEQTQRKFSDAADLLHNLDCEPVNPFQIGVSHSNASWKQHMIRDIELLMHCDGILLLDDWKESKGARIEKKIADEMGLIILHESSCRMIEQEQNILIRVKKAIKSVTGLDFETYISESRLRDYFYARMMFCYHCKQGGLTASSIADLVNRDRSTVLYYLKKYEDDFQYSKQFRIVAENVINELTRIEIKNT